MGVDHDKPIATAEHVGGDALWLGASWDDLRAFLAVSLHGSMSQAARALGESQPTIGRRMLRLEETTGLMLFERRSNGIRLTDAGHALAAALGPMIDASRGVAEVIGRYAPPTDYPIRMTATTTLALFLSEHVSRLRAAAATRDVVIIPTRLRANLLRGEADLALRMNSVEPENGLLVRKLAVVSFGFYALRGASDLPVILPSGDAKMSRHRALAAQEAMHRRQGPQIDELHLRLQAIRAGAGIGALPCWLGEADPTLERISQRADQFIHEEVYLVRTERSRQDPAVEAVARQLAAIFRKNRMRLGVQVSANVTPPPQSPASSAPR